MAQRYAARAGAAGAARLRAGHGAHSPRAQPVRGEARGAHQPGRGQAVGRAAQRWLFPRPRASRVYSGCESLCAAARRARSQPAQHAAAQPRHQAALSGARRHRHARRGRYAWQRHPPRRRRLHRAAESERVRVRVPHAVAFYSDFMLTGRASRRRMAQPRLRGKEIRGSAMHSAVIGILGLFLFASSFADAATITGTVSGPSGAPFRAAFVQASHAKLKMTVSVLSDNAGRYVVENLPAGDYRLSVRAIGYKAEPKGGIALAADQSLSQD